MVRRGLRDLATLTGGAYFNLLLGLAAAAWTARVLGLEELGRLAVAMGFYFASATLVESGCTQLIIADRPFGNGRGRAAMKGYRRRRLKLLPVLLLASAASWAAGVPVIGLAILCGGLVATYDDSWALYSVARFSETVVGETLARVANLVAVLVILPSIPSAGAAVACLSIGAVARLLFIQARIRFIPGWRDQHGGNYPIQRNAATRYLASRLMTVAMNQMAPAIYSASASLTAVGTFSAADRVVRAAQTGTNHYATFTLPRLALLQDGHRFKGAILRFGGGALALGLAITLALILTAPEFTDAMYGAEFGDTVGVIKLYAVLISISILSNYLNAAIVPILGNTWMSFNSNLVALAAFVVAVLVTWEERSPLHMVIVTLVPEVVFLACLAAAIGWRTRRRAEDHQA